MKVEQKKEGKKNEIERHLLQSSKRLLVLLINKTLLKLTKFKLVKNLIILMIDSLFAFESVILNKLREMTISIYYIFFKSLTNFY